MHAGIATHFIAQDKVSTYFTICAHSRKW